MREAVQGLHRPWGGSIVYFVRGKDGWERVIGMLFLTHINNKM